MLPNERRFMKNENGEVKRLCYAKPVKIGNDCWLGARVTVCSGVTIGDGCVIGAGSVVVRDIPPHTFAAGNPCRVIRQLTDKDSIRHKPDVLADNSIIEDEDYGKDSCSLYDIEKINPKLAGRERTLKSPFPPLHPSLSQTLYKRQD